MTLRCHYPWFERRSSMGAMSPRSVAEILPTGRSALVRVAVVLPAWQPDHRLTQLARELAEAGFTQIIVVDDGSSLASRSVFEQLTQTPGVTLCRHRQNLGKGCALKTGFQHVLRTSPRIAGVVTADADGQHTAADILRVARRLAASPDRVILGVRDFAAGAPWRSRLGNALTRWIFALLSARRLRDTQTGLRGLPRPLLRSLVQLPGQRYEYEMIMLAWLCRHRATLAQLPIQTVYLDGNRGSHFRPLLDSLRVYGSLLRFYCSPFRRFTRAAALDQASPLTA